MFIRFGDVTALDLPNIINGALSLKDFSNSLDLYHLHQVMEDERNFNMNDNVINHPPSLVLRRLKSLR